ncbi:hypothetical protein EVJ58_g6152 [Rhodofomes roseus]|uniref:Uncharacterized protein n=1 Tax=Rhodofomes roseus TaxID=34475 RepID=A0A4Y9Y8I9_9APHY|nr:hypothetical protein EVJ58_g6152 [Rhodofomes roseus]
MYIVLLAICTLRGSPHSNLPLYCAQAWTRCHLWPLLTSTLEHVLCARIAPRERAGSHEDLTNMAKLQLATDRSAAGVLVSDPKVWDIKIDSYTLSFHGRLLIEGAEVSLNHGQRYGLLGENGSRKPSFIQSNADGKAEPSDINAADYIITSAREKVTKIEQRIEDLSVADDVDDLEIALEKSYEELEELDLIFKHVRGEGVEHPARSWVQPADDGTSHKGHVWWMADGYLKEGKLNPKVEPTQCGFLQVFAAWIIEDDLPFTTGESPGLARVFQYMQSKFLLPTDTTVRNTITTIFAKMHAELVKELAAVKSKIAYSTDTWTTAQMMYTFAGTIASFIDDDWQLIERLVDFRHLLC